MNSNYILGKIPNFSRYVGISNGRIWDKEKSQLAKQRMIGKNLEIALSEGRKYWRPSLVVRLVRDDGVIETSKSVAQVMGITFLVNNDPIKKKLVDHRDERLFLNNNIKNLQWISTGDNIRKANHFWKEHEWSHDVHYNYIADFKAAIDDFNNEDYSSIVKEWEKNNGFV